MPKVLRPLLVPILLAISLPILLLAGCNEDERMTKLAREAVDRQAEQNRQIARQNQEIAGTAKALVAADAQSRKELVALQRDLQGQAAEIGRQRDQLEGERRQIAQAGERDPIIAEAITAIGILLACLLPLVFSVQLLKTLSQEKENPVLTEVVVGELVRRPLSLPPPPPAMLSLPGSPDSPSPAPLPRLTPPARGQDLVDKPRVKGSPPGPTPLPGRGSPHRRHHDRGPRRRRRPGSVASPGKGPARPRRDAPPS